ncbi:hypothetical protein OSB04_019745 [Centaurea solstitialis]|uniref:Protein kinase domain-containing protein n=1 Tax=Centaurea solstitialis TaxID=347529 RepID=A0AA38W5A7_9ASTR|nr:hypothetical protein OSB04_019745 [Centaurea solstitialis]
MSFLATSQEAESSLSREAPQLCRQFMLSEIQVATQNFDESMVIGRGGFGKVYKGNINNGTSLLKVAIKRLDLDSNQGEVEFWVEVKMLSKLAHCHLVSLIGYCNDEQEMILVYEYMSHGSLEDHLHKRGIFLSWMRRLKICIGAARGLDYLHTGTGIKHGIIHRDVKSSNILLHNSWAAKISDFGLSKICPKDQPSTHVDTFVKGTFGYLDPNYFETGKLTRKSDVYAFGVVLFEILSGKRAVDTSIDEEQWGLARWAQDSVNEGRLKQIVDPTIRGRISPKCLKEFARIAHRCLHSHPKQRPTMFEVVVGLEFVLALQQKANLKLQPADMATVVRNVTMSLYPSSTLNSSVGLPDLKSINTYLDTVGGEDRILCRFDFDTVNVATENFSEANEISHSSYYEMYKGRLQNGRDIAIVISSIYSKINKEYMNEVSILVQVEHENLFQLLGYCIDGTKLFLIYEFAPYASLGSLLSDPMCTLLDWNKRYKILLAVAKVLVYLHKHAPIRITHRDLNPNSVLLDESLDPKLSGFGVARSFVINETEVDLHETMWSEYIEPEYLNHGHLSTKVDVFNFGMMVLETVIRPSSTTGFANYEMLLKSYVERNLLEGTLLDIIDPRINVDSNMITRFIEIALLCTQTEAHAIDRPTMEEVVDMILGNSSPTLLLKTIQARTIIDNEIIDYEIQSTDLSDTGEVEDFISELSPR